MSDRIKLYTDEHVPSAINAGLRQRGVEVMSTPEAGMLAQLMRRICYWLPAWDVLSSLVMPIFCDCMLAG